MLPNNKCSVKILRAVNRFTPDSTRNNEVRGGGTTMKEAPLWAPSGKNLTTPEKYIEIANLVCPDFIQVIKINDYQIS